MSICCIFVCWKPGEGLLDKLQYKLLNQTLVKGGLINSLLYLHDNNLYCGRMTNLLWHQNGISPIRSGLENIIAWPVSYHHYQWSSPSLMLMNRLLNTTGRSLQMLNLSRIYVSHWRMGLERFNYVVNLIHLLNLFMYNTALSWLI